MRYGCIRFFDSFTFLLSSLDKLVERLVDISHKTLKYLKEEHVDNGELINIVNEIKILIKEVRYNNDSIKDSKYDYLDKIEKLEDALLNYMGEIDHKLFKNGFS